jgi:hypothetical protein
MYRRALAFVGFVVLCASASIAHATGTFLTQFEKAYGNLGNELGIFIVETADGGFLATARGPASNTLVFKIDANGNLEWQNFADPVGGATVVQMPDGGFVLGGGYAGDALLIKIDSGGAEEWRVSVGGNNGDGVYDLELAGDGSIVGTGPTFSSDIPGYQPTTAMAAFVFKVSDTGTVIDKRAFDQIGGTENFEEGYYIVKTPDDGFMVSGVAYSPTNWFLLRLDENLNKLWGDFYGPWYMQTIQNSPGGLISAGVTDDVESDAVLARLEPNPLDPDGPFIFSAGWPRFYERDDFDIYNIFYDAAPTPDGGIIAAGYHFLLTDPENPATETTRAWVVKTDVDGNIVREHLGALTSGAREVETTSDGGYVVIGGVSNFPGGGGGRDPYLLKLFDAVDPGFVEGTVWFDADRTCSVTGEDNPTNLRFVRLTDNSTSAAFLTMSGTDGNYSAAVPPGDYTVALVPNAITQDAPTCPPGGQSYQVSVGSGATTPDKDFNTTCTCGITQSLTSNAIPPLYVCPSGQPPATPCPTYPWQICYHVTNNCDHLNNTMNGSRFTEACINLPPGMVYDDVNEPHSVTNPVPCNGGWHIYSTDTTSSRVCFRHNVSFNFRNGCTSDLCFPVSVTNAFQGGSIVTAQFSTDTIQCPDQSVFPPAAPLAYGQVNCACDPNAKHVSPEGCGAGGAITSQELTYKVEFQNLGAGPAHDVVISDALDSDLDLSTLRLLDSSHTITNLQVSDEGSLVVTFAGIELPAEIADEPGSHGHVIFAITPKDPFANGTEIENSASIVFDTNAPVVTNTVLNTLYHGDPVPVAEFTATPHGEMIDFTYTGGTTGGTFAWDFGPNATPKTSTVTNPTGITFSGLAQSPVVLRATKAGCTAHTVKGVGLSCDTFWTTTDFNPSLARRIRGLNNRVRLKLKLSYRGEAITTQERLNEILNADFGRTAGGDCWPRASVFDDTGEKLTLGDNEFPGSGTNPDGCFKFRGNGTLSLNLKLNDTVFDANKTYVAKVEAFTCTLEPGANEITTKP